MRMRERTRTRRRRRRSRGSCEIGILAMLAKITKFNTISYQIPTGCARSSRGLRRTRKTSKQRTRKTSRQRTRGTSRQGPKTARISSISGKFQKFRLLPKLAPMTSALWRRQQRAKTRHFWMLYWKSEYEKKWCWETIVKVSNGTGLYAWFPQYSNPQCDRTSVKFLSNYHYQFIETVARVICQLT